MSETRSVRTDFPVVSLRDHILWGQESIAEFLGGGKGVDFVRELRKQPGVPIYKEGGRVYCFKDDLVEWLRHPHNRPSLTT